MNYVGAYATIRWNTDRPIRDESIQHGYYFSFEELPENFDHNEDYVLPLAGIHEENVFYFSSQSELLGMVNPEDYTSEFTVLEITDWVKAREEVKTK
jgi:YHS domain-containing protein